MRIAIVTDAWHPQTNGVVRSLEQTARQLQLRQHEVRMITPEGHRTVALPTYRDIPLAVFPGRRVRRQLREFAPQAIHIATEGPLGHAARAWCVRHGQRFTTSFHTQFPEYIRLRAPVPLAWSYAYLRRFHGRAERTMVATPSMARQLRQWGFKRLAFWSRGVDTDLFRPREKAFLDAPRPISLYAGRVAVEKNLEAFLQLELPGTKYVVGDGPDRLGLQARFPEVRFTGFQFGEPLARFMAAADVFVFPSRTDTFGLVMLEAMACAVPVAAFPVTGPVDVVQEGVTGALDEDLGEAVRRALSLPGEPCRGYALAHSWAACSAQFLGNLALNAEPGPAPQRLRRKRVEQ